MVPDILYRFPNYIIHFLFSNLGTLDMEIILLPYYLHMVVFHEYIK